MNRQGLQKQSRRRWFRRPLEGARTTPTPKNNALRKLPRYLVIGMPGAGKSTLLDRSGLRFPYTQHEHIHGQDESSTQNCMWRFSSDAVFLETTGSDINPAEDAQGGSDALQQLRHLPRRCSLNGIIVTVSIQHLTLASANEAERLAKRLRARIQEVNAHLQIRLPIYLAFTEADVIPGFTSFFRGLSTDVDAEVLGQTFAHKGDEKTDWTQRVDEAMDQLIRHWQAVADHQLALQDIQITRQDSAAYRFPLELAALKPVMHRFMEGLLRANPYQNVEWLRGFYFTSAFDANTQEDGVHERQVRERFALNAPSDSCAEPGTSRAMFINGLFRHVILPDQYLVTRYASTARTRRRTAAWMGAAMLIGATLCSLWTWSYGNNKAALAQIATELTAHAEQDRSLPDQYTAWHTLDRLRFWTAHYYAQHHDQRTPLNLGWGLYRGHDAERLLRQSYFNRLETIMLKPTAENLTRSLYLLSTIKVYPRTTEHLAPVAGMDSLEPHALPGDNRPQSIVDFGLSMLKTYALLSRAQHEEADPAFLKMKLPVFWYPAIARQIDRNASDKGRGLDTASQYELATRQVEFYSDQMHEPDVPRILENAFLTSSTRNYLNSLLAHSLRGVEMITLESDTLFAFGRGDYQSLNIEGQQQLSAIAGKLLSTPRIGRVVITGHADALGDPHSNLQVSRLRAETIKTYLVGKGLSAAQIQALGAGSNRPLVNCDMQLPRTQLIECLGPNRRVEIEIRARNDT